MLCSEDELSERAEHFQPLRKQREESQQGERHPKKWGKTWKTGYEMFSMGYMILKVRESRIFSESNSRSDT